MIEVGIRTQDSGSSHAGFSLRFPLAVLPERSPSFRTVFIGESRSVVHLRYCSQQKEDSNS